MRIVYAIAICFMLQSCDSLFTAIYKPDICDSEKKYKGKLKAKDFNAHKSKRPDME